MPPIDTNEDNHLLDHPHIFLDEIMRQAQDSEIIRLSMKIRKGEKIVPEDYKNDVKILSKKDLNTGMLQWADQILVATNNQRISINNKMRELLGRKDAPEEGDKVICLRNYWEFFSIDDDPLVNGTIGYLQNPFTANRHFYQYGLNVSALICNFITDTTEYPNVEIDNQMVLTGEKCCDWKTAYAISRRYGAEALPKEFTYGYAITCWKAQGSEWDKILLVEEKFPFDKEEHKRFLYTACTRAAKKFVWIRQG